MTTRTASPAGRRASTAAARQAVQRARQRERRRRWVFLGVVLGVVTVLAVAIGVVVGLGTRTTRPPAAGLLPSAPRLTAEGRTGPPPWPAPAGTADRVHAAGLPMLGEEGTVEHIHAHLDVTVDGKPVTVPAGIGVDEPNQRISPLHTHDATGVIHIESPARTEFSLGQFFTEWQVSLAADHIGALRADGGKLLRAYVNGTPASGDPAGILLHAHDEIALVYGGADQQGDPPAGYRFPAGE